MYQGQFWPSQVTWGSFWPKKGFRASEAPKISNKLVAYFFLILLAFLHLKWWNRYIFDDERSKVGKNIKNRAKMAKKGYTHMAIFWKNISSDLAQNGPKYLSRTNLHFNNNFGSGTHQKIFTTAILSFLTWLASPLGETVVPAQEWSECPGIKLDYFIYCHSRPFGPFWAILGHFGSFWAILGHFGHFEAFVAIGLLKNGLNGLESN